MNRIRTLIPLIATAILQITPNLVAQESGYQASVPFQFAVGETTLPAGTYRITRQGAFLHVQNQKNFTTVFAVTDSTAPSHDGQGHLVFDRVNGLYFLRELDAPSSTSSMRLSVSHMEKKARADASLLHTASSASDAPVIVSTGAR